MEKPQLLLLFPALLAAAVGTYVIVESVRRKQGQTTAAPKKRKTKVSLILEKEHLEWLREMAHKHNLPDQGKALRVLLSYAKNEGDNDIIYKKVRCIQCGKKDKIAEQFTIERAHESYIDTIMKAYELPDSNKVVRILIDYATSEGDEDVIFEVKRCVHGSSCKSC